MNGLIRSHYKHLSAHPDTRGRAGEELRTWDAHEVSALRLQAARSTYW